MTPGDIGGVIELGHGSGGRAGTRLVESVFRPLLGNPWLDRADDGAVLEPDAAGPLVMTTDSHVVSPLFFPGGDIGRLAVCGCVNDLAMMGARARWLSAGFILEEGFPLPDLRRIVESMAAACKEAGVAVVTADTKVVERGKGDGVFITTAGVGTRLSGQSPCGAGARPGDRILVSGTLGDHGITVFNAREELGLESAITSDVAPLGGLVEALFQAVAPGAVHAMRDPTRGGLGAVLNEIARQSGVGMVLDEAALPVSAPVRAACALTGLDPLYLANEGKCVVVCAPDQVEAALQALRGHPYGRDAVEVGEVIADENRFVRLNTPFGGQRLLDWLNADPLPRIC